MDMEPVEVGRLFGIPVVIDVSFLVIIILFGQHYFLSGDMHTFAYGVMLLFGIAVSILLHEVGHAMAGRYYGVPTSHLELNGAGGLCHFERAMPVARWPNIVILLAGPAVTLALWMFFGWLPKLLSDLPESYGAIGGIDQLSRLFWHLGWINSWLFFFNLLPSHPLDGGRAMAQLLSNFTGYDRAMRFIAYTGLAVIAWLIWMGVQGNWFAFIIAFVLFQANQAILSSHTGPRWKRWN